MKALQNDGLFFIDLVGNLHNCYAPKKIITVRRIIKLEITIVKSKVLGCRIKLQQKELVLWVDTIPVRLFWIILDF